MTINIGEVLPNYTLSRFGTKGLENIQLHDFIGNNKVILFGVPGAYSRTCSSKNLNSFIKTMKNFTEKGRENVICLAVNDPFVIA
nr:redoxin family protein [Paracoccaceae bacterium]